VERRRRRSPARAPPHVDYQPHILVKLRPI
jgi:hypothetical protein